MSISPLFISHGAPSLALDASPAGTFLDHIADTMPRPNAIVIMSAHWLTRDLKITTAAFPETIYDFGGFSDALYQIKYPAPTDPDMVSKIQHLATEAGITIVLDPTRGFDHGVWVPLSRMYPNADIPVIQLSVPLRWTPPDLVALGLALTRLSDEGVLLIGSGALTHNLGALDFKNNPAPHWVVAFRQWVIDSIQAHNIDALCQFETVAPFSKMNHPTPDHFLPILFAAGAGGLQNAVLIHESMELGTLAMDCWKFDGGQ